MAALPRELAGHAPLPPQNTLLKEQLLGEILRARPPDLACNGDVGERKGVV